MLQSMISSRAEPKGWRRAGLPDWLVRAPTLIVAVLAWGGCARGDSLCLTVEVAPGPFFVGQAVVVLLRISGGGADVAIIPPRTASAEIQPQDPGPSSSLGEGASSVAGRFVLIPKQAGILEIPPFRARSGGRTVVSRGLRRTVLGAPSPGRTSAFLGGVGPFEVRAAVEPAKLRLGQTLEFRIQLMGEAAWGSLRGPDLAGWASALGIRVEPLPGGEIEPKGPSRAFRYRLRPTRAGRSTLPPVAVAALDPTSRRFATKTTVGLSIEVEDPPRFDPASFHYGERPVTSPNRSRPVALRIGSGLVVISLVTTILLIRRRIVRSRSRRTAGTMALALAGRLDPSASGPDVARRITAGFAEILLVAAGRPPGVLTPPEAREAVAKLTRDDEVGERSGRLIGRCDRALYGAEGPDSAELVAEAREVLEVIRRALPAGKRDGGGAEGGSRDRIV